MPGMEFMFEGVDGIALRMKVAMDGKRFTAFPALCGADSAIEIGCDLLPGFEAIRRWRRGVQRIAVAPR